ncbi:MAG TPA: hypothetical protein DCZ95_13435 [Verrucomicrobia bacterium]|nr:MAG: hypothetical protein A2X46_11290 [Lentisphaerae bacterium GWF2_57_35]HBA85086.1 hypothetical protein [Verrucomicrobiota bacterium]
MSKNWNISGLIVEGICGTGKSTVFRSITRSPQFNQRTAPTLIALTEHHTQRVLEERERNEDLSPSRNGLLLDSHVAYLELLNRRLEEMPWRENGRTNMRVCYLLERFHFTHVYHYPHMRWEHVEPIDERLAQLNCRLCLLTIDESDFEKRIILDRDDGWREYLKRYGQTNAQIAAHYAKQQKLLIDLCKRSRLETTILNTSALSEADVLNHVLEFWKDI